MSIKIDLKKPLSEEEVEFLKLRGEWGERQLAQNKAHLSQQDFYNKKNSAPEPDEMSDEEKVKLLEEAEEWINNAKVPELKERLALEALPVEGKQEDLRKRLLDLVTKRYS